MKTITRKEAYTMYLDEDMDLVLPFESLFEYDYLEYLKTRGFVIV